MKSSGRARRNLEMQGYLGLDDDTVARVEPWLRLSPAICVTVATIGTALASPWVIWGLVPFAVGGALLPRHPFDVVYTYGFRLFLGGPRLPRSGPPRRFACGVATAWLLVTGAAFASGATVLGVTLGLTFVAVASAPVITGFCVPSFVFGLLFGRPARDQAVTAPSSTVRP